MKIIFIDEDGTQKDVKFDDLDILYQDCVSFYLHIKEYVDKEKIEIIKVAKNAMLAIIAQIANIATRAITALIAMRIISSAVM